MGATQSSYEDEYDENESGTEEMESNEMPVKVLIHSILLELQISDTLLNRMSRYVEEKTGNTEPEEEEEEEEPIEDKETEEKGNPDYFQEVMLVLKYKFIYRGIIDNVQVQEEV